MVDGVLELAIFELADSIAVISISLTRLDDDRDLEPFAGQLEPLLQLVLASQILHRLGVLGVQPDGLAVRVDGAVHFQFLGVPAPLHVPEVRILEGELHFAQLEVGHTASRHQVDFVDPVVDVVVQVGVFDVAQIVEFDHLQHEQVALVAAGGEILQNLLEVRVAVARAAGLGFEGHFFLWLILIAPVALGRIHVVNLPSDQLVDDVLLLRVEALLLGQCPESLVVSRVDLEALDSGGDVDAAELLVREGDVRHIGVRIHGISQVPSGVKSAVLGMLLGLFDCIQIRLGL